jgi:GTPase SAR1 family protein
MEQNSHKSLKDGKRGGFNVYEITSGKIAAAQKVVVYGPEGIGKSTFASQFPIHCLSIRKEALETWKYGVFLPPKAGRRFVKWRVISYKTQICAKHWLLILADWAST